MKLRLLGLLSLAMVVCLAPALMAQQEGRQRGQRGQGGPGGQRGGPGGFGRGGFGGGQNGATQLLGLLRMDEVRKDIAMADETWEAIQKQQPDFRSLPREEIGAAMEKFAEGAEDLLNECVEPEKQERLMGLLIQQTGYAAAANDLIAKKINLDKAGIEKVQEAQGEARRAAFEEMRGAGGNQGGGGQGGGRGGFDPARMQEMMAQMKVKTDEAVSKVLSKDQIATLDKMKGEKFEFPENAGFGGFGGGRGPGGPGGGRPGGGRPGGNRPGNDN